MKPDLDTLAEEATSWVFDRREGLRESVRHVLSKLQSHHEAERDAAVAEALRLAVQICDEELERLAGDMAECRGAVLLVRDEIKALKPRSDMVCVPEDYALPCEVLLPPGTIIGRGCSLKTLLTALSAPGRGSAKFNRERGPKFIIDALSAADEQKG